MSSDFRMVVPEVTAIPREIGADRADILFKKNTVLWQGDDYPSESVINSILEGQTDIRLRQMNLTYDNIPSNIGNEVYIQQRRKMRLGWFVVTSIRVPLR